MKQVRNKIKASLQNSITNLEGLTGDEAVKYLKIANAILDEVEKYHTQPRKVKNKVAEILDNHADI